MLKSLGKTAVQALLQRFRPAGDRPPCPGRWFEADVLPPSTALVHDFVRELGGDPSKVRGWLPPHLFPQWGLPLAAQALAGVPYPMLRVMNAGCLLQLHAPLPAGETLHVRARLESIDESDSRAVLSTRIVTGTRSAPDALEATLQAFVPLGRKERGAKKEPLRVPAEAETLERVVLDARAGLRFATLTGDFNPIHWIPPYARAAGFRGAILHGFGTFARAFEALTQQRLGGDPHALRQIEARFTRPLVLPGRVGVYVGPAPGQLWVGDAPGAEAYLTGTYETDA